MSDPWWYSGAGALGEGQAPGAATGGADDAPSSAGGPAGGEHRFDSLGDLFSMLSGAQRVVSWAAEAVMAPHADHDDPTEHPQCLLCRGALLLGETGLRGFGHDATGDEVAEGLRRAAAQPARTQAEPITWIPIRRP